MMKMFQELLTSTASGAEPVIVLERALTDLEITRDAAKAELASWPSAREQALRNGDDAELLRLRERRGALEDERDRAEIALKEVRSKLTEAVQTRRIARWSFHRAEHATATNTYVKAAHEALNAFAAIVAVRAAAINEGFAHEIQTEALPPNVNGNPLIAPDLLAAFVRKAPDAPQRRATAVVRKSSKPLLRMTDSQRPVRLGELLVQRRQRRAPLRETAEAEQVVISVLRAGIDLPGKGPLGIGDEVAVTAAQATDLVKAGAADFAHSATPLPQPTTTNEQVPA